MNYQAPRWLPGAHLQTIYPALFAPQPQIITHRERWDTPDHDFIDLDWTTQHVAENVPLVVLFHGLEGSVHSHYAQSILLACANQGWLAVVPHFRGCSGELNRLPRAYHSGDSAEINWIVRRLHQHHPHRPIYLVGISLGGNALLKWLGEEQTQAHFIQAAASISAPIDLAASAVALAHGMNRLYTRNFLKTLKQKTLQKVQQFPGLLNREAIEKSRDFFDFDEYVTAPLHGFKSAHDYWQRSAAKQFLTSIQVPTLILNAQNDPFLPPQFLPRPTEVSHYVTLEHPPHGGHVGFLTGRFPGNLQWLPKRLFQFFDKK